MVFLWVLNFTSLLNLEHSFKMVEFELFPDDLSEIKPPSRPFEFWFDTPEPEVKVQSRVTVSPPPSTVLVAPTPPPQVRIKTPKVEPNKIFMYNLPAYHPGLQYQLVNYFSRYGPVVNVSLPRGKSFGFLEFQFLHSVLQVLSLSLFLSLSLSSCSNMYSYQ